MNSGMTEVLKWMGLVLAAGFVGYFGRYLAMVIIDRAKRKKSHPADLSPAAPDREAHLEEARRKLEKKKAKARVKAEKKRKSS